MYRSQKHKFEKPFYPDFWKTPTSVQEFSELPVCIGKYHIDFSTFTGRIKEPTKNQEVIFLQTLLLDLVEKQYKYKNKTLASCKQSDEAKIVEQLEVLNEWWALLDPERRKSIKLARFQQVLLQRRIINSDSDF
jgi:hypothetical protein